MIHLSFSQGGIMNKKNGVFLFFLLVISISILTACGGGGDKSAGSSSSRNSSKTEAEMVARASIIGNDVYKFVGIKSFRVSQEINGNKLYIGEMQIKMIMTGGVVTTNFAGWYPNEP